MGTQAGSYGQMMRNERMSNYQPQIPNASYVGIADTK